jgi:hypothetical protein
MRISFHFFFAWEFKFFIDFHSGQCSQMKFWSMLLSGIFFSRLFSLLHKHKAYTKKNRFPSKLIIEHFSLLAYSHLPQQQKKTKNFFVYSFFRQWTCYTCKNKSSFSTAVKRKRFLNFLQWQNIQFFLLNCLWNNHEGKKNLLQIFSLKLRIYEKINLTAENYDASTSSHLVNLLSFLNFKPWFFLWMKG